MDTHPYAVNVARKILIQGCEETGAESGVGSCQSSVRGRSVDLGYLSTHGGYPILKS